MLARSILSLAGFLGAALGAGELGFAATTPESRFPLNVNGVVVDNANSAVADAHVLVLWVIAKPTSAVTVGLTCAGVTGTRTDPSGVYDADYPGSPVDSIAMPGELGRGVYVLVHKPGFDVPVASTTSSSSARPRRITAQAMTGESPRQVLQRLAELQKTIDSCRGTTAGVDRILHQFDRGLFDEARSLARTPEEKGIALGISRSLVMPIVNDSAWRPRESLTLEQAKLIVDGRLGAVIMHADLKAAVKEGNRERVMTLLVSGSDPNLDDGYGWSVLRHAISANHPQIALALLDSGARVRPDEASTLVSHAIFKEQTDVLEALLQRGVSLRPPDVAGSTFLHGAVAKSNSELVDLLLRHGADPNERGRSGDTPLHAAKTVEIVTRLLSAGADPNIPNKRGERRIAAFVRSGNPQLVEALLGAGANPNATDTLGTPVLIVAIGASSNEIARLLVNYGADVNVSFRKSTPLTRAASRGDADMVRMLMENGANLSGGTGLLALSLAAGKSPAIVRMLVGAGVSVNAQHDPRYHLPLTAAAGAGELQTVAFLLENGADIDARDEKGRTALMHAASRGQVKPIEHLVAAGADVNAVDSEGMTAVMHAVDSGFYRRRSSELADKSQCGRAPAAQAATRSATPRANAPSKSREVTIIEDVPSHRTQKKKITIIAGSRGGATVMSPSIQPSPNCRKERVNVRLGALRSLLDGSATLDIQENRYGWSALMMAADVDAQEAVKLLLEHGADRDRKNLAGDRAVDIARKGGSSTTASLLESR